ncbi:MAG TPA: hypothetical protein VMU21_10040 [Thermodesulfovibrionales bacterium]|nr:hypothetical protein [Thermodesulfovibrionales bacterium]
MRGFGVHPAVQKRCIAMEKQERESSVIIVSFVKCNSRVAQKEPL